jgi:hypothetical protein
MATKLKKRVKPTRTVWDLSDPLDLHSKIDAYRLVVFFSENVAVTDEPLVNFNDISLEELKDLLRLEQAYLDYNNRIAISDYFPVPDNFPLYN